MYKALYDLGMVEEEMTEEDFNQTTSSLVDTINFVDDLFLENDEATIKKFLTVIIYGGK